MIIFCQKKSEMFYTKKEEEKNNDFFGSMIFFKEILIPFGHFPDLVYGLSFIIFGGDLVFPNTYICCFDLLLFYISQFFYPITFTLLYMLNQNTYLYIYIWT